jgi:hypothetical protein
MHCCIPLHVFYITFHLTLLYSFPIMVFFTECFIIPQNSVLLTKKLLLTVLCVFSLGWSSFYSLLTMLFYSSHVIIILPHHAAYTPPHNLHSTVLFVVCFENSIFMSDSKHLTLRVWLNAFSFATVLKETALILDESCLNHCWCCISTVRDSAHLHRSCWKQH